MIRNLGDKVSTKSIKVECVSKNGVNLSGPYGGYTGSLDPLNHPASETFLNMMNSNYLLPYILQHTHVTDRSATLIDNIFANTFNFNALSGNLVIKISDHFLQFLIIEDLKVNYSSLNFSRTPLT